MKKCFKIFKSTVFVLVVLILVFGAGYCMGKSSTKETEDVVQSEKEIDIQLPGEVEKLAVTVDEVEAKILEIGELTSCESEYKVTKGKDFTRYMLDDIPIPGTTNHIEITCSGVVKVGYELKDVTVKVDEESKTIYVALPQAKVNSNQLFWDSSMMYNEKNNILNPIDFAEYQTMISEIKEEGLREAEKSGMYETVEDNAKKLITNFLGCFVDYKVAFM